MEIESIAKTGIKTILYGEKSGPTVVIRADIDALPMKEETGLDYASNVKTDYNGQETGVAHSCGHDAFTAAVLGTATVLTHLISELPGNMIFLFQPAEEGAPRWF